PGTKAKLVDEKKATLSTEERQVLDLPKDKLTPDQMEKRYRAEQKIAVTDREIAERIARDNPTEKIKTLHSASQIERQDKTLQYTINYKRDANYDYWKNRADFEQTADALDARRKMYEGRKAFHDADLPKAKQLYQEGFAKWRAVIDKFPAIMDEEQ